MRRRYVGTAAFALALAVGWYWLDWPFDGGEAPGPVIPAGDGTAAGEKVVDRSDYVEDRTCAECHPRIADSYARSGMARSWRIVDDSLAVDSEEKSAVDDPRSGYRYRVWNEDGRIVQEETLLEPALSPGHKLRYEARYAVGSGNHAIAFAAEHNGYLTQLPLNWFADEGRWGLSPGYEHNNLRFERSLLPGCIACHGGFAEVRGPAPNRYRQPVSHGIGCQKCHGPGKSHVEFRRRRADASTESDEDDSIVNPSRLSPQLGNDVCLQCHMQGDVAIHPPGMHAFSFRPGENLRDHRLDFLATGDRPESFGVASHGARLLQSRCHSASDRLTCYHCHDPHVPIADVPPEFFDARCIDCHQPQSCSRSVPPGEVKAAAGCVGCHMPQRSTREGLHLVFTDHLIRRGTGRPQAAAEFPQPAPLPLDADVRLQSAWPGVESDNLRLGSAYVLLHETATPQRPALEHGVRLLVEEHRQRRLDADAGYWLGSGLLSLGRPVEAIAFLEAVVSAEPQNLKARFRLGIACDAAGRPDAAIREYQTVVEEAEDWLEPYQPLVRLCLGRGQFERAVRLLEQRHGFKPSAETLAQLAVARGVSGAPPQEGLKLIRQALRLDPRLVNAHLTEAQLRTVLNQAGPAMESYRRALEIDPDNRHARAGLRELSSDGE